VGGRPGHPVTIGHRRVGATVVHVMQQITLGRVAHANPSSTLNRHESMPWLPD
jgi:hypothetical protein